MNDSLLLQQQQQQQQRFLYLNSQLKDKSSLLYLALFGQICKADPGRVEMVDKNRVALKFTGKSQLVGMSVGHLLPLWCFPFPAAVGHIGTQCCPHVQSPETNP